MDGVEQHEKNPRLAAYGRLGAAVMHSRNDSRLTTSAARAVFNARFEREVDPDGLLPESERRRRAEHARRAYYQRMSMASARARARRD
jgi:hypothetical protein